MFRNADSAATLVVGDIHGSFDELIALIELAQLGPRDTIVAVGDLVDRGPKSREVVEFFAADPSRRRSVRGNHEQKHLRSRGQPIRSRAGRILRKQVSERQYAAMLDYFETLPLWIDLPEALIVHAGLAPGLPVEGQEAGVLMGVGSSRRRGFDAKSPWWFDDPGLAVTKLIIFGHEKHPDGVVRGKRGNVLGIDTGAALGGPLTGVLLPEFRLLSVPVPDHWAIQQQIWLPELLAEDIPTLPWEDLFRIDAATLALPVALATELARARAAFLDIVARIEARRSELLADSDYVALDPSARAAQHGRWRAAACSELDRWAIETIPHRDVAQLVRRKVPTWSLLRQLMARNVGLSTR